AIVELAERLKASLPPAIDAVLVVNSGSEANDLAWRIARAATGRAGAAVTAFAYHGLTEATHALSPEEWAKGEQPAHVATGPAPGRDRGASRRGAGGRAGGGRLGGAVRRPRRRRRRRARRPRPRRDVRGPGLHRRRHPPAAARIPAGSGPAGAGPGRPAGGRRGAGRPRPDRDRAVELP